MKSRYVTWGGEPLQHISLCIEHLCSLLIVTCLNGKESKKELDAKDVAAFMKVKIGN